MLLEQDAILDDLRFNLIKAQQSMKKWADSKCRDELFVLVDLV